MPLRPSFLEFIREYWLVPFMIYKRANSQSCMIVLRYYKRSIWYCFETHETGLRQLFRLHFGNINEKKSPIGNILTDEPAKAARGHPKGKLDSHCWLKFEILFIWLPAKSIPIHLLTDLIILLDSYEIEKNRSFLKKRGFDEYPSLQRLTFILNVYRTLKAMIIAMMKEEEED